MPYRARTGGGIGFGTGFTTPFAPFGTGFFTATGGGIGLGTGFFTTIGGGTSWWWR